MIINHENRLDYYLDILMYFEREHGIQKNILSLETNYHKIDRECLVFIIMTEPQSYDLFIIYELKPSNH